MRPHHGSDSNTNQVLKREHNKTQPQAENCTEQLSLLSLCSPSTDIGACIDSPAYTVRRRRSSFTRPKRKTKIVAENEHFSPSPQPAQREGKPHFLQTFPLDHSVADFKNRTRLCVKRDAVHEHSKFQLQTPETGGLVKTPVDMKKQLMRIKANRKRPRELTTTIRRRVNLDSPDDLHSLRRARLARVFSMP